jgi:hypothetical protein
MGCKRNSESFQIIVTLLSAVTIFSLLLIIITSLYPDQQIMAQPSIPPVTSATRNFFTYENANFGISIQYPSNWEKIEKDDKYVRFTSPYESNLDTLRESLTVDIAVLPFQTVTLPDAVCAYIMKSKILVSGFQLIDDNNKLPMDIQNIEDQNKIALAIERCSTAFTEMFPNPTPLSGYPAHTIIFTDTFLVQGVTHRVEEMVELVVKQGQLYVIDYIADPQKFLFYLPIIQEMINSFEFTN